MNAFPFGEIAGFATRLAGVGAKSLKIYGTFVERKGLFQPVLDQGNMVKQMFIT